MRVKICTILFLLLSISTQAICQTGTNQYFITLNGNLYLPINNTNKGVYPILGYDKETDSKLLIGGLGAGISGFKKVKNKLSLNGQVNLSKHTYWDEPIMVTDEMGNPRGPFLSGSSDYSIGLIALVHIFMTEKISLGTGVAGQIQLLSLSRLPQINDSKKSIVVNRHYKPFIPTLPLELSFRSQRKIFNVRYEHGLINRLKGELKDYRKDKFGLLTFEVGFKIKE